MKDEYLRRRNDSALNSKERRSKMLPATRNTEIVISKEFLQTILEEKLDQFGFKDSDQIVKIDLVSIDNDPGKFWMKIKHKKQKEVEVIARSNGTELRKRE